MTDIIVYTMRETLKHKKGADVYQHYYWNFPRPPKQLEGGDKIYFACDGIIQGYFIVEEFNPDNKEMVVWNKDSWVELKRKIPTKSFQGFKYADKVYGLNEKE
ncbi:MAG: hypothetical protein K9L30_15815 [Desulfobacterales bacterium]|nr:hypothetical protein [Desulfobacterales bacterium]